MSLLDIDLHNLDTNQQLTSKYLTDGLGFSQLASPPGEGPGALKHQIIGTLHAATYMRGKCLHLPSPLPHFPSCSEYTRCTLPDGDHSCARSSFGYHQRHSHRLETDYWLNYYWLLQRTMT